MSKNHVVIVGTGQESRLALDIFNGLDVIVLGFLTDEADQVRKDLNDVSIFAMIEDDDARTVLSDSQSQYFVAIGDIPHRKSINERLGGMVGRPPANATHPNAWISPYAHTGFGNLFSHGAVVHANSQVGDLNYFHSHVNVEPDVKIGHFNTFSSGVRIGSNVVVEDEVFVGTGAIIYPGVKLGKGCLVGAGSVVLAEVEPGSKVFGNPAAAV